MFSICDYMGIELEYVVWILAGIVLIQFLMLLVNSVRTKKLKKKYLQFMGNTNAKSMEETIVNRLEELEDLLQTSEENRDQLKRLERQMSVTFQKVGLIKYDAFDESGGKLSFSLALLNENEDGFIINAMHSREGCYTYIKEIIAGKSIILLTKEEQEALEMAVNYK